LKEINFKTLSFTEKIKAVFAYMKHPNNRGRLLSFMARYLAWQIRKRTVSRPKVVEFFDGLRIYAYGDCSEAALVVYCGLPEYDEMLFVSNYLEPGDCFVDVGANIGVFSLIAAKRVGRAGKVFAFEPLQKIGDRLKENLDLNQIDWVEIQEKCVGDFDGEVKFTEGRDLSTGHLATSLQSEEGLDHKNDFMAPICRLDTFLSDKECASIPIVKADVEGSELFMLKGAVETLKNKKVDVWILESNHRCKLYGYPRSEMFDLLRDYGYSLCLYDAKLNRIEEISQLEEFYHDIWAVLDVDVTQRRLDRIEKERST